MRRRQRQRLDRVDQGRELVDRSVNFRFDLLQHGEMPNDLFRQRSDGVGEVREGRTEARRSIARRPFFCRPERGAATREGPRIVVRRTRRGRADLSGRLTAIGCRGRYGLGDA